ncbi:ABC transporter ATP-binding protein [Desulfosporosinus shakirovi]|uniref:ABC transporter ATP-binding protein n=1 Tax=Desulfosporosinus shakirovi TaxID=2885154 RepID=UPI001E5E2A9E|nr:ABC transporter ATP-binding protein [Desulfosporosinus sp. SRJS8]MCB8815904.1 ABC transporter ATP-binding protein [Desulfosporosinus sp. SRJS8]
MQTKPVAQFKNIKKRIGSKLIIDDISFEVNAGEIFGFLGPNGAGKTTTIRMLFGLISISEGEISVNGFSITDDFEKAIAGMGGIVENPEMYKYLTGYQNLVHYARMYGNLTKERIDEVVALVGLEQRIKDKVKTYSLGMRQRLGLAQAILHKPSLIVLDEPTNGLDPAGIHEFRMHLRQLAEKENVAVLVSSHLLGEMELMCDRIGIIQNGKLVDIQTVNDFLAKDEVVMRVTFTVDDVIKAKACLNKLYKDQDTIVKETSISILMDTVRIPDIVTAFVHEEIRVSGIDKETQTLEDKFLKITGGSGIA